MSTRIIKRELIELVIEKPTSVTLKIVSFTQNEIISDFVTHQAEKYRKNAQRTKI